MHGDRHGQLSRPETTDDRSRALTGRTRLRGQVLGPTDCDCVQDRDRQRPWLSGLDGGLGGNALGFGDEARQGSTLPGNGGCGRIRTAAWSLQATKAKARGETWAGPPWPSVDRTALIRGAKDWQVFWGASSLSFWPSSHGVSDTARVTTTRRENGQRKRTGRRLGRLNGRLQGSTRIHWTSVFRE